MYQQGQRVVSVGIMSSVTTGRNASVSATSRWPSAIGAPAAECSAAKFGSAALMRSGEISSSSAWRAVAVARGDRYGNRLADAPLSASAHVK
jgi:hypothetical protein